MAASAREHARTHDRSSRLILEHIHDIYIRRDEKKPHAQRSRKRFVDSLRRYPPVVLQEAERRFRSQVHRSDIRDRASDFAKLVGLMGNRRRAENLARCRELLGAAPVPEADDPTGSEGGDAETSCTLRCVFCGSTDLVCVGVVPFGTPLGSTVVVRWDTS